MAEGHSVSELKFKTPWYPLFAFIASLASCLLIWFNPAQRVALYATVPFVGLCYLAHYFYAKKKQAKA